MLTSLPNLLTLSRIAAIPMIVALFFVPSDWAAWSACALYAAAAVTDYFDGMLARQMRQVSPIGKFLDPIADKLLVAAVLFMLASFGRLENLAILPAVVILMRELMISGLREFLAGADVGLPVSRLAKWKTGVQMAALGLLIVREATADWPLPVGPLGDIGLWIAAVLTVVTGWSYLTTGLRHLAQAGAERQDEHKGGRRAARTTG